MKHFYSYGNMLWYLRWSIAKLLIGKDTCAFNLRVEDGGIVVRMRKKSVFVNVVVIGAPKAAFTFIED